MSCHILHYIPRTQEVFAFLFDIFCYCSSGGYLALQELLANWDSIQGQFFWLTKLLISNWKKSFTKFAKKLIIKPKLNKVKIEEDLTDCTTSLNKKANVRFFFPRYTLFVKNTGLRSPCKQSRFLWYICFVPISSIKEAIKEALLAGWS